MRPALDRPMPIAALRAFPWCWPVEPAASEASETARRLVDSMAWSSGRACYLSLHRFSRVRFLWSAEARARPTTSYAADLILRLLTHEFEARHSQRQF